MLWRHLCLVRAWSAAGLPSGMMLLGGSIATAQSPAAPAATRAEPSAPPAEVTTETVDLLRGRQGGRPDRGRTRPGTGQGPFDPRTIRTKSPAQRDRAARAGRGEQGRPGRRRGRRRPRNAEHRAWARWRNREGAFGEFQADAPRAGLRSIPTTGEPPSRSVAVPAGESVDLTITGVCLNYGLPAPTGRDKLTVMDVDEYTTDPRDPQGAPHPLDARHQPRRRPGGDVAALQRPHVRGDDGAIRQGHEPVGDRPGRPVRRGPRGIDLA